MLALIPIAECRTGNRNAGKLVAGSIGTRCLEASAFGSDKRRLERMEGDFARSEGAPGLAELETYQPMANTMRRLLEALGLQRRARDVTPSLGQYLTARATAAGNGEPAGESNAAGPSPASADAGNRIGEASAGDSVPSESAE